MWLPVTAVLRNLDSNGVWWTVDCGRETQSLLSPRHLPWRDSGLSPLLPRVSDPCSLLPTLGGLQEYIHLTHWVTKPTLNEGPTCPASISVPIRAELNSKLKKNMRGLKKGYGHLWLPRWLSGKEFTRQGSGHRRLRFHPWIGKIPWRRKWQRTPVFLPKICHGQRSLAGYNP